ncbi:MAG: hypothetical protein E6Q34_09430 [Burkholderiaceae bacterium]|nr:MAG: hypothetical protein E6Q34_09430 [Burkholderiaceae bacterium]
MKVLHILSVEELRDGGSLVIGFQADDACSYWLMLPIIVRGTNEGTFGTPALVNRTTAIEVDLSWVGANNWLCKLECFIEDEEHESTLNRMRVVIHENLKKCT